MVVWHMKSHMVIFVLLCCDVIHCSKHATNEHGLDVFRCVQWLTVSTISYTSYAMHVFMPSLPPPLITPLFESTDYIYMGVHVNNNYLN